MKTLMFAVLTLTATVLAAATAGYNASPIPSEMAEPVVMPGEINYQGVLRNPKTNTEYADGIYHLECRLYTDVNAGTCLWGAAYPAYVKNGYFNIMLGGSGAEPLSGCKYEPTELWKALWYVQGRRDLYLGVTPREDASHNLLATDNIVEIKPRQKLLTAPFAFRAQMSQYADAAPGNFAVAGNLNVAGDVTMSSGKSLTLKNITASDSEIKVGTSKTSPWTTTLQGNSVVVEAGSKLNVNSHGNATVTMDAGKTLNVMGGKVNVDNEKVTVKSSDYIDIDGEHLYLRGGEVVGHGTFKWNVLGRNDGTVAAQKTPFVFRRVQVTIPAKSSYNTSTSLSHLIPEIGENVRYYSWSIAGHSIVKSGMGDGDWEGTRLSTLAIGGSDITNPLVSVRCEDTADVARTFTIDVMGVLRAWSDDTRGTK